MQNWDEMRTVAYVARLGTVSAAARELGIHRATVNRHIELLETEFGTKLFLRAQKGYTPTELGRELQRIAELTETNFKELHRVARLGGTKLHGELIISTVELLLPYLLPAIARFSWENPQVRTKLITTDAIVRLEYGEADIAFRPGAEPKEPDSVVVPFNTIRFGLFASQSYLDRHGRPKDAEDLRNHHFVVPASTVLKQSPFMRWLGKTVPPSAVRVECSEGHRIASAVDAGVGIGFVPQGLARDMPNLVEVIERRPTWAIKSWRVTHVDVHRTEKIKEFLRVLSAA